jgi:hypothetical protein
MAFTRFHDDPCRIMKQLQESTDQGTYYLNTPGNGEAPPYIADSHIRLQYWAGNRSSNMTQLESSLFNMDNKLSRDCRSTKAIPTPIQYPQNAKEITAQPRTTMPAWVLRDQTAATRDAYLPEDPQAHTVMPFRNQLDTRAMAKDKDPLVYFRPI